MEIIDAKQDSILQAKINYFNAGKKNLGGAAYNLLHLGYDLTTDGEKLAKIDEDSHVRALVRARNLNDRANGGYDILSGKPRQLV